ncbi:MAG: hypothetical protein ACR2II_07860 [Chthoniobacterales bacterium]
MSAIVCTSRAGSGDITQTVKTARFANPTGLALDRKGNLYVADSTHGIIRKITPAGEVSTLAGRDRDRGNYPDGTGNQATFDSPTYLAIDGADNLYTGKLFGDRIRKITPAGVVTTLAAKPRELHGIAIDHAGSLYFVDENCVRKVSPEGKLKTIVGAPQPEESGPAPGSVSPFQHLGGVAIDSAGNVFVTDGYTIRKVTPSGEISTVAGASGKSGYVDATGSAARFYDPTNLTFDGTDDLYVADKRTVRKITPDGVVSTVAGKPTLGAYNKGGFEWVSGIALDKAGNIYVADSNAALIRTITSDGAVNTLAGKYKDTDE